MNKAASYYAHGKLLLTGEYAVLLGAEALAIPTAKGQVLHYSEGSQGLEWYSYDQHDDLWFSARFDKEARLVNSSDASTAHFLRHLLLKAAELSDCGFPRGKVSTHLEFPQDWGLGSSSTLLHLVAQWLGADPMKLFFAAFEGSGYDVACAGSEQPIIYQLQETARWRTTSLPECYQKLLFVHLNTKQRSLPEVRRFKKAPKDPARLEAISALTQAFLKLSKASELALLMDEHERLMSEWLACQTVKERLFSDFRGSVKSLGAWGGDFVMALGPDSEAYFKNKGYHTIRRFDEMCL